MLICGLVPSSLLSSYGKKKPSNLHHDTTVEHNITNLGSFMVFLKKNKRVKDLFQKYKT